MDAALAVWMYQPTLEELVAMGTGGELLLVNNIGIHHWDTIEAVVLKKVVVDVVLVGKRTDAADETLEVDPGGCARGKMCTEAGGLRSS